MWWLWFITVPLALRTAGYFPGKRLRKVGDPPPGVMQRWRRWSSQSRIRRVAPKARWSPRRLRRCRAPMLSLSFTDDDDDVGEGHQSLHGLLSANAPVEYRRIAPREIGARHIGHFGFFRPSSNKHLAARAAMAGACVESLVRGEKKIACARFITSRTPASEMASGG